MRRVIFIPATDEVLPDSSYHYQLPIAGDYVVDSTVPDDWNTKGTILHDMNADLTITVQLSEPAPHHYAGWEF